ncbi:unnamed protein product [Phytophthora fragariaefolia]|uniref:Unnamed protein product n=1 Tax=Phytophthora fragariaefolia TaxID=1490495 RepID=A0A9W7D0A5_9STRA|nr:unnamed protein product [Phytophthora fragariaefolia]
MESQERFRYFHSQHGEAQLGDGDVTRPVEQVPPPLGASFITNQSVLQAMASFSSFVWSEPGDAATPDELLPPNGQL